ncbi:hypothetical protein BLNAU_6074 [Blattamonas nauphoetae]|uniref:Uncharacterized protein n=1 Tax=Blattamonas nauphoetae TaxID=2049346 RepID=A0ABQ9Y5P8_9EUKA|nr:hypothetical protein BLNAU_6074 [Blattamonas nauphoetae]
MGRERRQLTRAVRKWEQQILGKLDEEGCCDAVERNIRFNHPDLSEKRVCVFMCAQLAHSTLDLGDAPMHMWVGRRCGRGWN